MLSEHPFFVSKGPPCVGAALLASQTREGVSKMAKCWCDQVHKRGDARNGEVKHFVSNWKLYQFRNGQEKAQGKG